MSALRMLHCTYIVSMVYVLLDMLLSTTVSLINAELGVVEYLYRLALAFFFMHEELLYFLNCFLSC